MSEGLWSVELRVKLGKKELAGVVVVLDGQRIIGGDTQYYYVGIYEIKDGVVDSEVELNYYGVDPEIPKPSIFSGSLTTVERRKFHVKISGKLHPINMELQGYVVEDPNRQFVVSLAKRSGLPDILTPPKEDTGSLDEPQVITQEDQWKR